MKYLLSLISLFLFVIFQLCPAQSVNLFDLDISAYPKIKSKIVVLDKDGNIMRNLQPEDITIKENTKERQVLSIDCPQDETKRVKISSLLTVDVSGSMSHDGLDIVQQACSTWVNMLLKEENECALTAFDGTSELRMDFTDNIDNLKYAFQGLKPLYGTDYQEAFLRPKFGALDVAKHGRFKRIIIFITDGFPDNPPDVEEVIRQANEYGITVFSIVMSLRAPQSLRDISEATGGAYYEHVYNISGLLEAFTRIYYTVQSDNPCTITWLSEKVCDPKVKVEAIIPSISRSYNTGYSLPSSFVRHIELSASKLYFEDIEPGKKYEKYVTITGAGDPIEVKGITTDNKLFSISDFGGTPPPFILNPEEKRTLKVQFAPVDSSFQKSQLIIESNSCYNNSVMLASWSSPDYQNMNGLAIVEPNGGEEYIAGSDTVITWTGLPAYTKVRLDYSIDSGKKWTFITDTATGYSYKWHVPSTPSRECIMKATKANPESKILRKNDLNSMSWRGDDSLCALVHPFHVSILEPSTGKVEKVLLDTATLKKSNMQVMMDAAWSPDGRLIATSGAAPEITVWDYESVNIISRIKTPDKIFNSSPGWSPDGKYISAINESLFVWSYPDGSLAFDLGDCPVYCWINNSPVIASQISGSGRISFFDTESQTSTYLSAPDLKQIVSSPDGSKLYYLVSTGDTSSTYTIGVVDTKNSKLEKEIRVFVNGDQVSLQAGNNNQVYIVYDRAVSCYVLDCNSNKVTDYTSSYDKTTCHDFSMSHDMSYYSFISNNCLYIYDRKAGKMATVFTNIAGSSRISWSKYGQRYLSSDNSTIYTIDKEISGNIPVGRLKAASFNADGSMISAIGMTNDTIYFFDADTYAITGQIFFDGISSNWSLYGDSYDWGSSGYKLAYSKGSELIVKDLLKDTTYNPGITYIYNKRIKFSPDEKMIAEVGDNSSVYLYDYVNNTQVLKLDSSKEAYQIRWSPDGKMIAGCMPTYYNNYDGKIRLWDTKTGKMLKSLVIKYPNSIREIAWSYNSRYLAVGTSNSNVTIWNIKSGVTDTIAHDFDRGLAWCQGNDAILYCTRTMLGCNGQSLRLEAIDHSVISDCSDSLWSIVTPEALASDIDMGTTFVNNSKDSVVVGFIKNTGSWPVIVDSIAFKGQDQSEFGLVSGIPPYTIEKDSSQDVEFRFYPKSLGDKAAEIYIYCRHKTLKHNIKGTAIDNDFALGTNIIDFGKVEINTTKDSLACILRNGGVKPFTLDSIYIADAASRFIIYDSAKGKAIQPGEELRVRLGFNPDKPGRMSTSLFIKVRNVDLPARTYLFGEGVEPCHYLILNYSGLRFDSNLTFVGHATAVDSAARLTSSAIKQSGALWYNKMVPIDKGFITRFSFRFSYGRDNNSPDGSYPGADGIAFVIQNSSPKALGSAGGGIGYNGIENSIAIEIDNYDNDSTQIENLNDPNGNHLAIQTGYDKSNTSVHSESSTLAMDKYMSVIRSDGTVYHAMIEYTTNPDVLRVWIDTTGNFTDPIIDQAISIDKTINLKDNKYAYIGFTSATGTSCQAHDILGWSFCPYGYEKPVDVEEVSAESGPGMDVYPNPASGSITIKYPVTSPSRINISIFSLMGRKVGEIADQFQEPGSYYINYSISGLEAGTYFIKYRCNNDLQIRKLTISR